MGRHRVIPPTITVKGEKAQAFVIFFGEQAKGGFDLTILGSLHRNPGPLEVEYRPVQLVKHGDERIWKLVTS